MLSCYGRVPRLYVRAALTLHPLFCCCSLTGPWALVLKRWLLLRLSVELCSPVPVTPVISMRSARSSLATEPHRANSLPEIPEQWTSAQEEEALQASTVPHSPRQIIPNSLKLIKLHLWTATDLADSGPDSSKRCNSTNWCLGSAWLIFLQIWVV